MAIVEVVKYDGSPDVFAWKYPNNELGTWTQLIVNESQEAVLYKGGQALDLFTGGRHTLETANIPLLNKLINLPFGGRSPFSAEVWFINKACSLDIKWGTATPIQLQDPKYGVFIPVRAYGQFGISIEQLKQFLLKLVGTLPIFDKQSVLNYFRGMYLTKAKDAISSYLVKQKISVMEINAYISELSDFLKEEMQPILAEYGIKLLNFYVNDVSVPEEDPAVQRLKEALAKKAEMDIIGYNYQQERSFDTLEGAAKNEGSISAPLMGAGLGLGMGAAVGEAVGGQFMGLANELNPKAVKTCPQCKSAMDQNKRFCADCGFDAFQGQAGHEDKDDGKVVCSKCGAAFQNTMKFCPECGDQYIKCPSCGADFDQEAEACPKCGFTYPLPCPSCGAALPGEHAKFCPECGKPLANQCPACHAELDGSPKFCPECGKNLRE